MVYTVCRLTIAPTSEHNQAFSMDHIPNIPILLECTAFMMTQLNFLTLTVNAAADSKLTILSTVQVCKNLLFSLESDVLMTIVVFFVRSYTAFYLFNHHHHQLLGETEAERSTSEGFRIFAIPVFELLKYYTRFNDSSYLSYCIRKTLSPRHTIKCEHDIYGIIILK